MQRTDADVGDRITLVINELGNRILTERASFEAKLQVHSNADSLVAFPNPDVFTAYFQSDREALVVAQRALKDTLHSLSGSLQQKLSGVTELIAAERAARREETSSFSSSLSSHLRELRESVRSIIR
jgi:hypothetical protein